MEIKKENMAVSADVKLGVAFLGLAPRLLGL